MKIFFSKFFPSKKKIQIEFCQNNLDRHLNEKTTLAFSQLLQQSHIHYKEYECLSNCSTCRKSAYAIVNGQVIEANHIDELLLLLKEQVSK
ncbi:DUF1450 domain-containing protein [Peribacillus asahii]|uniref:Uncharacterized protein n=1 Tax=Peribacillus asahii TaxID=228899 RepID=A0A3T0KXP2_9BACI|nr:DUF1450 domain-containing protein [Peribacillus asahii]AZV45115.1 hypothetical protein BAOM_4535 [Peribacillus asahii]USK84726.1 YuzB family protein [Peribacillus asahii]